VPKGPTAFGIGKTKTIHVAAYGPGPTIYHGSLIPVRFCKRDDHLHCRSMAPARARSLDRLPNGHDGKNSKTDYVKRNY
jgi:hypothetical protein